jgi:O-antigen ligase
VFMSFFINLPFVKGKSFSFLILPKEFVRLAIRRDLIYYFPFTISDFYLLIVLWIHFRTKGAKNKKAVPYFTVACLTVYLAVSIVSALMSEQLAVSLLSTVLLFKLVVIFLLPSFIKFSSGRIKTMIIIMCSFTIFEGAWGVLQNIFRGSLGRYIESFNNAYTYGKMAWENKSLLRASGTFVDPDLYGTFMFMHFIVFLYLLLSSKNITKMKLLLYGICVLLASVSVFITGNRVLYICYAASLLGMLLVLKKIRFVVAAMKRPRVLVGILCALAFVSPYVAVRTQNFLAVFLQGSATFRIQIAEYALRLGWANILGVGPGVSPYHFALDFPGATVLFGPDYPHAIFFQIFAETGIFGLMIFLMFLYTAFRPLIIRARNVQYSYLYLAAGAYIISACFYPLYIPLVELPSFFFLYLGIAVFANI